MQLAIIRDQVDKRGMLGGHKGVNFSLYYELRLTERERRLVEQYRLGSHALTYQAIRGQEMPSTTVAQAIQGIMQTMDSVAVLVNNEKVIKEAVEEFKLLLDVASTFGGEDVIDIGEQPLEFGAGSAS